MANAMRDLQLASHLQSVNVTDTVLYCLVMGTMVSESLYTIAQPRVEPVTRPTPDRLCHHATPEYWIT